MPAPCRDTRCVFEALERLQLDSLRRLSGQLQQLVETRLWLRVLLAMALGMGAGFAIGPDAGIVPTWVSSPIGQWAALPGALFLGLLQMIVVPLVFASVIRGLTASENIETLKRTGLRAVLIFVATTGVATATGIWLALVIRPGAYVPTVQIDRGGAPSEMAEADVPALPGFAELPDRLAGILPTNPLASMVSSEMLEIILFATVLGIALLSLPRERSAPLYELLASVQDACLAVVKWAMRLAPIAVFGLMLQLTATVGLDTLGGMAVYVLTVLLGLGVLFVGYLALGRFGAGIPVGRFVSRARELLLLAFSTSSSAAVMPRSIEAAEDGFGVRDSISRFVIPLGTTINMTGTALYQGVATVFLAQIYGVELGVSAYALVVVTAVAASIGSPATPGVGMVILAMVLATVGIPPSGVVLLLGVDRILDMSRTVINVMGDVVTCCVLERFAGPRVAEPQGQTQNAPSPSTRSQSIPEGQA